MGEWKRVVKFFFVFFKTVFVLGLLFLWLYHFLLMLVNTNNTLTHWLWREENKANVRA